MFVLLWYASQDGMTSFSLYRLYVYWSRRPVSRHVLIAFTQACGAVGTTYVCICTSLCPYLQHAVLKIPHSNTARTRIPLSVSQRRRYGSVLACKDCLLRLDYSAHFGQTTYVANNMYLTAAVFIKISLLLQYLRICKYNCMK
jgi:hypothetical protein